MDILLMIATALAPVLFMTAYIYRNDLKKEPKIQIVIAIMYGMASVMFTLMMVAPFKGADVDLNTNSSIIDCLYSSFFFAAIPEEIAKFACFYLLVRHNPYFDEYYDGIFYAAIVSLGFAGVENIVYLANNINNWVAVGISRAVLSVPLHFMCGIAMGYYYSLYHFGLSRKKKTFMMCLAAPILIHGIFDFIVFLTQAKPYLAIFTFIILCLFLKNVRKRATAKIQTLKDMDRETETETGQDGQEY